jgi:hypothetical protein
MFVASPVAQTAGAGYRIAGRSQRAGGPLDVARAPNGCGPDSSTRLLERGRGGSRLTQAGELLVEHVEAVLARLELAEAALESCGEPSRIAAFSTAAAAILPAALDVFAKRHPHASLTAADYEPEQGMPLLKSRDLDIALIYEYDLVRHSAGSGIETHLLVVDPLFVALPEDHRLASLVVCTTGRPGRGAVDMRRSRERLLRRTRARVPCGRFRALGRTSQQQLRGCPEPRRRRSWPGCLARTRATAPLRASGGQADSRPATDPARAHGDQSGQHGSSSDAGDDRDPAGVTAVPSG